MEETIQNDSELEGIDIADKTSQDINQNNSGIEDVEKDEFNEEEFGAEFARNKEIS
ncbi:hypothetical protein Glove_718g55 [Diversispora epigaea]|uniref:Uncharacterized protein n=1 Tax=Diversispora epigaea TaxID=1348612 RepID=A0A397G4S6_9GLOM|nr:hypothetical protein Glove_718g55 [Diversispora epigaea]